MSQKPVSRPLPFLFGAQYYRAPTPEPECWPADLERIKALGFNAVKYWVQWRWSHRQRDRLVFDDLDPLMDLAQANGLQVTLNVIFDVSPHWLFERYPDARQVMNNGHVIEPYTVGHRQIGGHPGPCYNHPGALSERKKFMAATIQHFRGHPALAMWDVWNEPELSFPQRAPHTETLVCYCAHCQARFLAWLMKKYGSVERLNQVWGRCYDSWEQIELPRNPHTFTDFVDWREFHIDTMTREATWRLDMVREQDPGRVAYLHVVPNVMSAFNSISCCADDFDLAERCDLFAATMNGGPILATQVVSAARGKLCYNVESHLNHGCTSFHQRMLALPDLLRDWLPQIGMGIRGFLFWQYRPEVLGFESPAWGVVGLDGSDRPITGAVRSFWQALSPHVDALLRCPPQPAEIGIWKSRKNEIMHFCMHQELSPLVESVEAYIQALYWHSYPYRIVSGQMLERGQLDGLKLLIMPSPYYLTEAEAQHLMAWVQGGGVLISEAHLGGYNGTTGRHSRALPGCGLAEVWGIREADSTSSYHLKLESAETFQGSVTEDVRKALADLGTSGGLYFPIRLAGGTLAWGASRYAALESQDANVEGCFAADVPCLISKSVGHGTVFYCGTNLGQGARQGETGLVELVRKAATRAGVAPTLNLVSGIPGQVHLDLLQDDHGPRFLMVVNRSADEQAIRLPSLGMASCHGLFSGLDWALRGDQPISVPAGLVDLFVL